MPDIRIHVRYRPDHADDPIRFVDGNGNDIQRITVTVADTTLTFVKKDDSPAFTFAGFEATDDEGEPIESDDSPFTTQINNTEEQPDNDPPIPYMVVTDSDGETADYGFKVGIYPNGNTSSGITWSTLTFSRKRTADPIPEIINQADDR